MIISFKELNRFSIHQTEMSNQNEKTRFQSLPPELILETFDYLHDDEIRLAFHGLNKRLTTLIDTMPQKYLDLSATSAREMVEVNVFLPSFDFSMTNFDLFSDSRRSEWKFDQNSEMFGSNR